MLADGPLGYWRLDDANDSVMTDSSGHNQTGAYAGGVAQETAGALTNDSDSAVKFDGSSGNAQVALDLSSVTTATIEFWSNWTGAPGDDRLAFEYTDASHAFYDASGFMLSPDSSWEQGFEVSMSNGSGVRFSGGKFARPTNGAWHHYAIVLERASGTIKPYVDGALQPFTYSVSGTSATPFGNLTLWLMSRHGSGQFGAGSLDEVAVYPTALSASQIATHYAAAGSADRTAVSTSDVAGVGLSGQYDGRALPLSTEVVNPLRGSYEWHREKPQPPGWPVLDGYARLSWRDLEPEPNNYDFSDIDRELARVEGRGGKFGFEVLSASSPNGMIVPQYLADQMPKGFWFSISGSGKPDTYAPDWNSQVFLDRAQALVTALGRRYDDDPRIGWIEIGLYGDWGEWHVANYPYPARTGATDLTPENAQRIIDMYVKAFPNKHLIMTIGLRPDALKYALNLSPKMGWRTNCLGSRNMGIVDADAELKAMLQNRWLTAPLLTEYCPDHSGSQAFQRAVDQVAAYHVAAIGNGNVDPWDTYTQDEHTYFTRANLLAGYRFVLDHANFNTELTAGSSLAIQSSWSNVGVTPTYDPWDVMFQLRDHQNNIVWQGSSRLDLQQLRPTADASGHDVPSVLTDTYTVSNVPAGDYDLVLNVLDPAKYSAPLALAMEGRRDDGSYLLGSVTVDAPDGT